MRCTSFLFILGFTTISAASEVASDLAPRAQAAIAETFGALSQNLMKALQEGGVRQAVPFCQENAAGLVKPIAEKQGLRIQRVSHKARNPANRATDADDTPTVQADAVTAAYIAAGFSRVSRDDLGEWSALVLKRN